MHHQRQLAAPSRFNVRAKPVALPLHVGHAAPVQAIVVKASLADGDHAGSERELDQVFNRRLFDALIVWMDTGAAPKVVIARRKCMDLVELFEGGADAKRPAHLGSGHFCANGVYALTEIRETQVTVGIDVHTGAKRLGTSPTFKSSESASRRRWLSPGSLRSSLSARASFRRWESARQRLGCAPRRHWPA